MRGLLAWLLLCLAIPVAAQDIAPLAWLEGRWQGPGTMFGNPSDAEMDARGVPGGRFVELSWRAGGFEGRTWGSAETERGRTVYRLRDDGRLEVVDSVMTGDGGAREFARHVLSRAFSSE